MEQTLCDNCNQKPDVEWKVLFKDRSVVMCTTCVHDAFGGDEDDEPIGCVMNTETHTVIVG